MASSPPSDLDSTFGCLFLSVIFSTALWGVGCLQLYYYYDKFWATDPRWLKVYIFLLWMVDTAQQALRLEINYVFFVKGIADPTLLNHLPRTFAWSGILVAIVDAMAQVLFVRRAWHLSNKSCILSAVLFIFVLGQFAATMIYSARLYSFSQLSQVKEAIHLELAMNCIMAFTDTMLALVLIYLLWKGRSGIKRTNSVVNRLITYTVGSTQFLHLLGHRRVASKVVLQLLTCFTQLSRVASRASPERDRWNEPMS